MVVVICWIVTHTSLDRFDDRAYKQYKGYVMHETSDTLTVNLYEAFKKGGVNLKFNPAVQIMNDSECQYE